MWWCACERVRACGVEADTWIACVIASTISCCPDCFSSITVPTCSPIVSMSVSETSPAVRMIDSMSAVVLVLSCATESPTAATPKANASVADCNSA